MLKRISPYLLSLGGVLSDYTTTTQGLRLGFSEINSHYHPVLALVVFWGLITLLAWALPKKNSMNLGVHALVFLSFLGAINNAALILGLFPGL